MESNKHVIIVGESNSLKSKLITECFITDEVTKKYKITAACNGSHAGVFVNYVKENCINFCFVGSDLSKSAFSDVINMKDSVCFVLTGWPYIVGKDFICDFSSRVINCHGSYLPDYKGSRAYMHYWANIEDYYGVTIHYVNEGVDEGNIIKQVKVKQFIEETPVIIHRRMAELTGFILDSSLDMVFSSYEGTVQESAGRYFKKTTSDVFNALREHNENCDMNERIKTPHYIKSGGGK